MIWCFVIFSIRNVTPSWPVWIQFNNNVVLYVWERVSEWRWSDVKAPMGYWKGRGMGSGSDKGTIRYLASSQGGSVKRKRRRAVGEIQKNYQTTYVRGMRCEGGEYHRRTFLYLFPLKEYLRNGPYLLPVEPSHHRLCFLKTLFLQASSLYQGESIKQYRVIVTLSPQGSTQSSHLHQIPYTYILWRNVNSLTTQLLRTWPFLIPRPLLKYGTLSGNSEPSFVYDAKELSVEESLIYSYTSLT